MRIRGLIEDWQVSPPPLEVSGFTLEEIGRASGKPRGVAAFSKGQAFKEVISLLPYLRRIVEHLIENYSDYTILVLGRDAELIYVALRIYLAGTPEAERIELFPGSKIFWWRMDTEYKSEIGIEQSRYLQIKGIKDIDNMYFTDEQQREFLATFGITQESIDEGRKFLLLDTGFYGSIAMHTHTVVKRLFDITDEQLEELFPSRLIEVGDDYYEGTTRLLQLEEDMKELQQDFPWTIPGIIEFLAQYRKELDVTPNLIIACALQMLPHHHNDYAALARDEDGHLIAVPLEKGHISWNVDARDSLNPNIINPYGAMLPKWIVGQYFRGLQQGRDAEDIVAEIIGAFETLKTVPPVTEPSVIEAKAADMAPADEIASPADTEHPRVGPGSFDFDLESMVWPGAADADDVSREGESMQTRQASEEGEELAEPIQDLLEEETLQELMARLLTLGARYRDIAFAAHKEAAALLPPGTFGVMHHLDERARIAREIGPQQAAIYERYGVDELAVELKATFERIREYDPPAGSNSWYAWMKEQLGLSMDDIIQRDLEAFEAMGSPEERAKIKEINLIKFALRYGNARYFFNDKRVDRDLVRILFELGWLRLESTVETVSGDTHYTFTINREEINTVVLFNGDYVEEQPDAFQREIQPGQRVFIITISREQERRLRERQYIAVRLGKDMFIVRISEGSKAARQWDQLISSGEEFSYDFSQMGTIIDIRANRDLIEALAKAK